MDCWKRFDWVSYLSYAEPVYNKRRETMNEELSRIGLQSRCYLNVRSPFDDLARANLRSVRGSLQDPSRFNMTMGHYRMVKTAYTIGSTCALFMEDDVRFAKDLSIVEAVIESIPDDFDLLLMDWVFKNKRTPHDLNVLEKAPLINGHWKRFTDLRCAGCYVMNRKGMLRYLTLIEDAVRRGSKLEHADQYWPGMVHHGLNCYCSYPHVAIQGVRDSTTSYDLITRKYADIHVNMNEYNIE